MARIRSESGTPKLLRGLCSVLCLCASLIGAVKATAEAQPIVVLLSWDGMRHDYLDRGDYPGLSRVESEGVRAQRLRPVFPSKTFPGHVSLATGTYPDRHGIIDNLFLDSEKGRYAYEADANWMQAEPLWVATERQGLKAATYFWVGSESDWRDQRSSYRIAPFDDSRPEAEKVDQILDWLSLPSGERPNLVMSYWAGTDSVAHNLGPDSAFVDTQVGDQDAQLVRLLEGIDALGLWPQLTLILVSDHGMAVTGATVDLAGALADAGIEAQIFGTPVAQIHLQDPADGPETRAVLTELLSDIAGARFYPENEIPAEWRLAHPTRSGDWIATVPPPYDFAGSAGWESVLRSILVFFGKEFGSHGFDPSLADMGGIFLAMGRGVASHRMIGEVHQIDVAATVSELLGIEPPLQSEGVPIDL
jgi:predicted AlkP superfamily pyrophosphatase or phosphodiesterase